MKKIALSILFVIVFLVIFSLPAVDYGDKNVQECFVWTALIPLIASLLSTGGTLLAQDNANKKAGKERQKYQSQLQGRIDDLNDWFNTENNRDFLTTDIAQSSIRGMLGQQDRQISALNNASAAGGLTAESNIAAKGKLNENFADAIGKLLGYGTQYKQGLRQEYDYRLQSLYQPMDQLTQGKINDYNNLSNNITAAGNSISMAAGMIDWEDLLKKQNGNYAATTDWGTGEGYSTGGQ